MTSPIADAPESHNDPLTAVFFDLAKPIEPHFTKFDRLWSFVRMTASVVAGDR
jgi:hypothetical protein